MKAITYDGIEEVQKITLHSLEAKGILRIYEMTYASLNELFKEEEATALRQQFIDNRIRVRELTNVPYRDREIGVPDFDKWVEVRYIDTQSIHYKTEIIIYNDVVAFYTYGKTAHGMEIHDPGFAQTQIQIFDQLWRKASRPIIGPGGRTSLI